MKKIWRVWRKVRGQKQRVNHVKRKNLAEVVYTAKK